MKSTFEAWQSGEPIYSRLPGYNGDYNRNETVKHLVKYWDDFLVFQKSQGDLLFEKNLNAETCDSEYLDFLGYFSFYNGRFWDRSWTDSAKRKLITGSNIVWNYFGTFESLGYVLNAFDIRHKLQNVGDFLVDISTVGEPLGDITWSYRIYLPPEYQGTEIEEKVKDLNYLFGVGYCESEIVFDEARFRIIEILTTDNNEILTTDDDEALELE